MDFTKRPDIDQWGMLLAYLVATRSTCLRRSVGCVLLDSHNHVLATGYNGVASGAPHCNHLSEDPTLEFPFACEGASLPSGKGLNKCQAIHAEQNALLQVSNALEIKYCFTTSSPCIHCVKLLLNTTCEEIFFSEEYPHNEARTMWECSGRKWTMVAIDPIYLAHIWNKTATEKDIGMTTISTAGIVSSINIPT